MVIFMLTSAKDNLKKLDYYLFNQKLYKLYCELYLRYNAKIQEFYKKNIIKKIKKLPYTEMKFFYLIDNHKSKNLLGQLLDKYGSAKSVYTCTDDIYDLIFKFTQEKVNRVIECGIGGSSIKTRYLPGPKRNLTVAGAALRAYRDYFFNAEIIGIDIDKSILFTDERIKTYECDQTKPESIKKFIQQANLKPKSVDIIIDDGLRTFLAKITLLESLCNILVDNGIYLMEWIPADKLDKYIEYFKNLITKYKVRFISLSNQIYPCFAILIVKNNNYK
jgi:hypothetical protein